MLEKKLFIPLKIFVKQEKERRKENQAHNSRNIHL